MNAEDSLKLARRFIGLPLEKRQMFLQALQKEGIDFSRFPIPASVEADDRQALSYAQQRMWFLWQLDPQSGAYNLPSAVRLTGRLNESAMEQAFAGLIERHETLRTVFVQDADDQPRQVPVAQALHITRADISTMTPIDREAWVQAEAERVALQPFDLSQGPLLRVQLIKLAEQEHVLLLTLHHIVSDGWSMGVLIEEFTRLYGATDAGQVANLPPLPIQYSDYALWQRRWLEAGEQQRQLAYWREALGDEHPVLDLPTDHPRPARPSQRGARHEWVIAPDLADGLRQSARQQEVTLFMLLLGAFGTLLHRYSGQADIRIGVPIANRNRSEIEGLIGFFVNTQVLRIQFDAQTPGDQLLRQVKAAALGAQAHQDLPFEQLVEGLDLARDASHHPLFQVMYNHQPQVANLETLAVSADLQLSAVEWSSRTTRFDLTLDTFERGGQLCAAFTYASDLFDPHTIERMAEHWQTLLAALVQAPKARVGDLPLLADDQVQQALVQWNNTQAERDPALCIHHLIERQAAARPDTTALVFAGQSLTYQQLNQQANRLAHRLIALGVSADVPVGIAVERSLDMIVGMLAILKAGGAYVPLDPDFPTQRLLHMAEDSGIHLLVTQSGLVKRLPALVGVQHLLIDQHDEQPASNPDVALDPDHLAYVIYTSGSTGKAKGVTLSHRSLVNYVQGILQTLPLADARSMAVVSTLSADLGHTTLFGALCSGCTLHVLGLDLTLDAERFGAYMAEQQIDVLKIVPSHLEALLSDDPHAGGLPRQCLIMGGEAASPALLARIRTHGDGCRVINHYGPTETTVGVLTTANEAPTQSVLPLGRPLPNTTAYILEDGLQPAMVGASAELYLGGVGLARGYLGRAAMTAERFVPHPFGTTGERLYRTGDLARYRADGSIEFKGRVDHQVKVRGYRIELGEINGCLRQHPGVREAVTLVAGAADNPHLVAYVVLKDGCNSDDLRTALGHELPEYMVPAVFVSLDALPLTLNGKLDLQALAALQQDLPQVVHQAPVTDLQQRLAAVWAQVLKIDQVGLQDNFFSLGGHSLLATQIISRTRRVLGTDVALRTVFETATFGEFCAAVEQGDPSSIRPVITRLANQQPRLASFAQQRQWLFWTLEPDSVAYHTPIIVKLQGELDHTALEQTFAALAARHEAFRTRFVLDGDVLCQHVDAVSRVTVQWQVLEGPVEPAVMAETHALFDLAEGPLMRVKVFQLDAQQHLLVVTLHHIISDGASMGVLGREFAALYAAFQARQPLELPALTVQYADYAQWQRDWLAAGEMQRQLDYWRGQLGTEHPLLELATDHPRRDGQGYREGRVDFTFDPTLAAGVCALAQRSQLTLFQFFVASFGLLLQRYSGSDDLRIGVPVSNRNAQELEGVVGFFVNTLVLRLQPEPQLSVLALLQQAKATALAAQAHQDLPFDKLVEALNPQRSLQHNPLFQVMYNHLNTVGAAGADSLPGLRAAEVVLDGGMAQFDLTLETLETDHGIRAAFIYAADLFEASTLQTLAGQWRQLLAAMVADPQQAIGELVVHTDEEQRALISHGQRPEGEYASVIHLFERQVSQAPDAIALIAGDQRLSYRQLDARANHLAQRLLDAGVTAEMPVGLALPRSAELVVGLLAIFKAGAAFVPLDLQYPAERLAYMIEDSGIAVLLTQACVVEQLPTVDGVGTVLLDGAQEQVIAPTLSGLRGEGLAYVIYTSGSTGQPKGVGIEHAALAMHCRAAGERYAVTRDDCQLQFASISFDAAAEQIFMPLIHGARLVLGEVGQWSFEQLLTQIRQHRISILDLPPSYLNAMAQHADPAEAGVDVRVCILGGEAWGAGQLAALKIIRAAQLFNAYGPTEAVISPLIWACDEQRLAQGTYAAIGAPVGARSACVLDGNLNLLANNAVGELYIGGEGLARGYLGRPGQTAQQFVPDPFSATGARLYRTGDLARRDADGVFDYVGRIDHQVKIRGFRVELGEIEARLLALPQVREAVVQTSAARQLVAYLVLSDESAVDAIKAQLGASLPDYMQPSHWVLLDALPLLPSGKLDRKALPEPHISQAEDHYLAPQNAMEQQLAEIWAQVLKLERVGVQDNFFDLGGDSIISIQVVSRARQAGIHFKPKDLFQHQTVQGVARVAVLGDSVQRIDQGTVHGDQPLLPVQQVFFEEVRSQRHHWNQSVMLLCRQPLEPQRLEQALQALISHHDALRLAFAEGDGWQAHYPERDPQPTILWQAEGCTQQGWQALCDKAQRSLDLAHGPLVRGVLATLADGQQKLFLAIHHLVVDGVSWRILFEDLQTAYRQLAEGKPVQLPLKTSALQTWGQQLALYGASPTLQAELPFWQAQQAIGEQALPGANLAGGQLNRHAITVHSRLDKSLTRRLLQDAPAAYRTQVNDLLLTALAQVMCRWTGRDSTVIQLEGHGRQELFDGIDLTRTVGWFTSLFPVRLTPADQLGRSLKAIKEQLRAVPNKGIGYGVLRYLGDDACRATLHSAPTAPVTFNYLGQFDGSFDDDQALFVPSGESAGADQNDEAPLGSLLTLNGQVYDGELSLGWTFSGQVFDEAVIAGLADEYSAILEALVEHCCEAGVVGLTPSDVPLAGLSQAQLDGLGLPLAELDDLYPLSPMQQGMLFHSLYQQDGGDYINQMRVDVHGLDVARFKAAWQATVQAHDILRSGFIWQSELGRPLQWVHRQPALPFAEHDWRGREGVPAALEVLAIEERQRGFELAEAPLLRLVLVQTSDDTWHFIYSNHHILMDGWSYSRLLGEVLQRYHGQAVAAPAGRYRDYIGWLQAQDGVVSEQFWQQQLVVLEEPSRLAPALSAFGSLDTTVSRAAHMRQMDAVASDHLAAFARAQKVTVNTLVQAAWLLLLQRYTGQNAVAFGATQAGRPAQVPGAEQQIGLFINTLPIIAEPAAQLTVGQWLQQVQTLNLAVREHEHMPLFEIQRLAGLGGEALFDTLLVFENYPVAEALQQSAATGLTFGEVLSHEQTHYPLALAVEAGETLILNFDYATAQFSAQAIERLAAHLLNVLAQLVQGPDTRLGGIALMNAAQEAAAVAAGSAASSVPALLVHQRIAQIARQTPTHTAVVQGERSLDFASLDRQANQLAHALIAQGVGPEVRVAVALPRSEHLLVALLAVLKAGGAYVPLDITHPAERLAYLMSDCAAALVLTDSTLTAQMTLATQARVVEIDRLDLAPWPQTEPLVVLHPDNLAYVIYTSGSTGQPKGVAVTHGPLAMHCTSIGERYGMTPADCELLFMSFAFDGAHERWLTTLTHGGRVLLRDEELWTPEQTFDALHRHGVTVAAFPPVYLQHLAEHAQKVGSPPPVRIYCFGGDAVPQASFELARRALKPQFIINGYGPTETVVTPLIWKAGSDDHCEAAYAPIGTRIGERSLQVRDLELNLLPDGLSGELYLGGYGVARGYLNRPAMTAERFVPDPASDNGARLYRSGDLVRQRESGVIDCLGRIDHQVKIRGFRIELGEVEARLKDQASVRDALVVAQDSAHGKVLVAYLVAEPFVQAPNELGKTLKVALESVLPGYMVPSQWVVLERFPLNPNGKIDRKALPLPQAMTAAHYSPPVGELELQVAAIWGEILKLERVGREDAFFELGGHSLMATQVVMRLRQQLQVDVPLKLLFETRDLADFCEQVALLQAGGDDLVDELTKSLGDLTRLSAEELEKLIS